MLIGAFSCFKCELHLFKLVIFLGWAHRWHPFNDTIYNKSISRNNELGDYLPTISCISHLQNINFNHSLQFIFKMKCKYKPVGPPPLIWKPHVKIDWHDQASTNDFQCLIWPFSEHWKWPMLIILIINLNRIIIEWRGTSQTFKKK